MTGFLGQFGGQLGKSLADKWLGLLALPGALFVAVVAAGSVLGHAHALDASRLVAAVTGWAGAFATVGGQIVLLLAVLAVSVGVGLVARVVGAGLERLVLAAEWRSWPLPARAVARWLTRVRRGRWDEAHREYSALWVEAARAKARQGHVDPDARHAALRARTSVAAERPDRPTWTGDRIHGVSARLLRDHRVDVGLVWPYLWLLLPEQERKELTAARTAMVRGSELGAWALLYAAAAALWWPAGVVAVVLAVVCRHRLRTATDSYARLTEAAVRLHTRELAQQLGIEAEGPLNDEIGDRLDEALGSAPPVSPGEDQSS